MREVRALARRVLEQRFNGYFGVASNGVVNPARAVQPISQALYDSMMSMQLTELAAYDFTEFWVKSKIEGDSACGRTPPPSIHSQ